MKKKVCLVVQVESWILILSICGKVGRRNPDRPHVSHWEVAVFRMTKQLLCRRALVKHHVGLW
jgi:hypothetical protein